MAARARVNVKHPCNPIGGAPVVALRPHSKMAK